MYITLLRNHTDCGADFGDADAALCHSLGSGCLFVWPRVLRHRAEVHVHSLGLEAVGFGSWDWSCALGALLRADPKVVQQEGLAFFESKSVWPILSRSTTVEWAFSPWHLCEHWI